MSEQEKAEEAGNEQDSAVSQQENCIHSKTESSEADEKDENDQKQDTNQQKKRAKSGGKGKLVRSLAVCEESCPRMDSEIDNQSP